MNGTLTREAAQDSTAALKALRSTSPAGLVDAVIQLTHRIHAYDDCADDASSDRIREFYSAKATGARAQRDMVKAEILRRAAQ